MNKKESSSTDALLESLKKIQEEKVDARELQFKVGDKVRAVIAPPKEIVANITAFAANPYDGDIWTVTGSGQYLMFLTKKGVQVRVVAIVEHFEKVNYRELTAEEKEENIDIWKKAND